MRPLRSFVHDHLTTRGVVLVCLGLVVVLPAIMAGIAAILSRARASLVGGARRRHEDAERRRLQELRALEAHLTARKQYARHLVATLRMLTGEDDAAPF